MIGRFCLFSDTLYFKLKNVTPKNEEALRKNTDFQRTRGTISTRNKLTKHLQKPQRNFYYPYFKHCTNLNTLSKYQVVI